MDSSTISLTYSEKPSYIVPMQDVIGALGGFRGVRADLLVALKKRQPLTAHELGAQFGLTANALRRHLKVLEDDGLVRFAREVRGVGAPVYCYALSAAGEALFPRSYLSVLTTTLELVRRELGDAAVTGVLEADWARLVEEAGPVLRELPLSERVALVAELLTSKGFMADVALVGGVGEAITTTLRIHNCTMREIAERFPEACAVEAKFMELLLGVSLVRSRHRQDGCGRCEYAVPQDGVAAVATSETMTWQQEQV